VRIFATVGLEAFAFDRFVDAIDSGVETGALPTDTFIQYGSSSRVPRFAEGAAYLDYPQMCERIERADVVVTHAGVGTFLHCVRAGKVPVIVPRRHGLHEHVDDHQSEFSTAVAETGMAIVVDPGGALRGPALGAAIARHVLPASELAAPRLFGETKALIDYVGRFLRNAEDGRG
jgi:UDP-N-acetylglucosamine transferase subunit ALG13